MATEVVTPQERDAASSRRRVVVRLLQAAVTVGLIVLVWQFADGADAVSVVLAANPWWIGAALLALTVHTVLAAERWRITAGALGLPLGRGHALREYYLAQLVNSTVPGGVVGDAGRAVRSRDHAGLTVAAQAVVVERFAGQVMLLTTMVVATALTTVIPGGTDWPGWMLGLAATITAVSLVGLGLVLASTRLPGPAGARLAELTRTAGVAVAGRRMVAPQLALSAGTTAAILAAFAFSALAVGLSLSVAEVVVLVPLILLTMLIPVTISGWGLREGAAVALLPLAGATPSESLAASVTFGLVGLAAVLPGVTVVWMRSREQR